MKIATFFTLAHSVTLTLAGLGLLTLPPRPVEVIIALSIVLAALHNLRPLFANKEWAIAFGFGLFHGLGFAGLLSDLGLDKANRFWSLFGFNLGVELGQAVIILTTFPVLFLLRRTRLYVPLMKAASVCLAVLAFGWVVERAFDVSLNVDRVIEHVVAWPRAAGLLGVAAVAAGVFQWFEGSRGRLRAVAGASTEPVPTEKSLQTV
jgi:hypothetical protein